MISWLIDTFHSVQVVTQLQNQKYECIKSSRVYNVLLYFVHSPNKLVNRGDK